MMHDFTKLEKFLLTGTVVFGVATITLSIVWALTNNNNSSNDHVNNTSNVTQITIYNSFILPGRTEPIKVKFHTSYDATPSEITVFSTPGESSPLSFGNISTSSEGISVDIRRGQLHTTSSKFSGDKYTGCAAYQLDPILFNVYFQTDKDLFLSEFNTKQQTFSDPTSVFHSDNDNFLANKLSAISPNQFFTATNNFKLLVVIVAKDGTSKARDVQVNDSPTSVIGFKDNLMFIDKTTVYHYIYTNDTWTKPYKQLYDGVSNALGTYVMPGKPNMLVIASTSINVTRLQGFLQPAETIGNWIVSSFIDLTMTYDFITSVEAKLYMTENTAGTDVSIAFMSGKSTIVMVRVNRELSTKTQEKSLDLPMKGDIVYKIQNILTYRNEAGDDEVQVILHQGDSIVSIIFDSDLSVRDGGDILSIMSAPGAAGFTVGTSTIPNGQLQTIVQVQDKVITKALSSYQLSIASWSPSVSISVMSEKNMTVVY
jgi:hypothetical protein